MTILVVDNYDSFAYNLVQYVGEALIDAGLTDQEARDAVVVRRNDAIDADGIRELDPAGVVVSPGPGTPEQAGVSMAVFELNYPALGVCLGHQALCATNGVAVGHAPDVVHGKSTTVTHDGDGIFEDLPSPLEGGRYHSLAAHGDLPDCLVETARTDDEEGVVMGVRHAELPHEGVQFHPESILTPHGKQMVRTFVGSCLE